MNAATDRRAREASPKTGPDLGPTAVLGEELASLRRVSTLRGLASVAWTWSWIAAAFAFFILRPGPLSFIVGFVIVSGRHLALAILMHEAAHGLLVGGGRRVNDVVGNVLTAWPIMLETSAYRGIHARHHRLTWTEDDPDLALAAPFPVSRRSFARKVARDLTGITGVRRYAFIARVSGVRGLGGFVVANALLLAALTLAGSPEAFLLLWILPALTGYSLILRIRSIAEHAAISDPSDPLRQTRTTLTWFWVRFLIAPHHVGWHLEHHLFPFVPHYRLPRVHRILRERGLLENAEVAHGYIEVLRRATAGGDDVGGETRRASGTAVERGALTSYARAG